MPKIPWADVKVGDRLDLPNGDWTVSKIKTKGKRTKVTVTDGRRAHAAEVKSRDLVKRKKPAPLHVNGEQQRWATDAEAKKKRGIDFSKLAAELEQPVAPPEPPSGDAWGKPRDRVERMLDTVLDARLVAEGDPATGYYVPPVDVTTIAAHLALMHPNVYDPAKDEAAMLAGHEHEHKMVLEGRAKLDKNHWHTATRPVAA